MLVANRKDRLFESTALDLREEGRKLFFRCQKRSPRGFSVMQARFQAGMVTKPLGQDDCPRLCR
jgi:hypothetical protein